MPSFDFDSEHRVLVERGVAHSAAAAHRPAGIDRTYLLFDPAVEADAGQIGTAWEVAASIPVVGGERAKSLTTVEQIGETLRAHHCTRHSMLLVLGGGSLTDLGGFVASTYLRGIACALIPSTMLGMCDAAIGGKNGVDLGGYKNLFGTFTLPRLTLIDPDILTTLPNPLIREGAVEVVKKAAILDATPFEWIESVGAPALDASHGDAAIDPAILEEWITHGVRLKCDVVREDLRESGRRELLNFGHTVGHALETVTEFGITHAQAVSIGMAIELRLVNSPLVERVEKVLTQLGQPVEPPAVDIARVFDAMRSDKKVRDDQVRIAVPTQLGRGEIRAVTESELRDAWTS